MVFGIFKRKLKRYASLIVLIGMLGKPGLSYAKDDPDLVQFKTLTTEVQNDLERGVPNKARLKLYTRLLAKMKNKGRFKGVNVPLQLAGAVDNLSDFYIELEVAKSRINDYGSGRILFVEITIDQIIELMELLRDAQNDSGLDLKEEKEELQKFIRELVGKANKQGHDLNFDSKLKIKLKNVECFLNCGDLTGMSCSFNYDNQISLFSH